MESDRPTFQSFGEALRWWRKKRDMHQEQLAAAAGTFQGTISKLEAGDTGVSVQLLVKLSRALDLTSEDMAELASLTAARADRAEAGVV